MALTRKESTKQYDDERATKQNKPRGTTVSYQDQATTKTKMGPTSSTVEGSK